MWRPEGWNESAEATAKQCANDPEFVNAEFINVVRGMFEAGADAMLETLKKRGILLTAKELERIRIDNPPSQGYLTLIPDED